MRTARVSRRRARMGKACRSSTRNLSPSSRPTPSASVLRALSFGPVQLTALGIGSIIGTGIFVLTGTAAALNAGPALVLSMVFAAVACGLAGLCYAELAAMIPVAGSAYTYAYATIGELAAWIIGWDLILEYALSTATVAVGWSGYFVSFLESLRRPSPRGMLTAAPGAGRRVQPARRVDRARRRRAAREGHPGVRHREHDPRRREIARARRLRRRRCRVREARET